MRIRKRLASSYLPTTPPLSNPHHHRPSDQPPHTPNQPSDHIMAIRRWVLSENHNTPEKMKDKQKEFETWKLMDQEKKSTSTINDDIRKIVSILNEEGSTNKIMQPSSHSAQGGFEGDSYNEVVPLMKRKRSCFRDPNEAKMKSKTNNNFKEENGIFNMNNLTKKNKRGNVIMEGSRCSRVNGRGWRCCHPTLVGYSLCEHHLGKGRARIVANQDCGGGGGVVAAMGGGENPREQPAAAVFTKKRTKVGVVKARSMSSLLGQI